MTDNRIAVIYHGKDLDGVMSASVVAFYYLDTNTDITMIPYDYGLPIPDISDYDIIYVVDISFGKNNMEIMRRWIERGKHVVWIDHHKTSIADERKIDILIPGLRRVGTAACELTWEYLMEDRKAPLPLQYLGAYDVWNKERFVWDKTMEFQYGFRSEIGLDINKGIRNIILWDRVMDDRGVKDFMSEIMDKGWGILNFLREKYKAEMERCSFEANIHGFKAIAVNSIDAASLIFDSVWDELRYDVMIAFSYNGRFFTFSLYTTKDDIDCGELARSVSPGGGGHRQAAGFQMHPDRFLEFLRTKEIGTYDKEDNSI